MAAVLYVYVVWKGKAMRTISIGLWDSLFLFALVQCDRTGPCPDPDALGEIHD